MAQAYTAPDWGTGEGVSPSNLQAISNTLEAIVQGADRAIHHIDIAEGNTTVTYIDGTVETYAISGLRGISSVIKRTDGAVDTYTIVYTDGTSYTFNITNGTDGNGIIGIIEIPDPTIPINVKKYRILFTDGTHFDYEVRDGINGRNGQDGVGITDIRETKTDNIHTITIIMSNGQAVEFEIADGINTEEAAEVIAARGDFDSLGERLDATDEEVDTLSEALKQMNTNTSTDTLDYAINGNIVSADFVGYARKSKNLLGNDANVYYPIDIKSGDVYSVTKANGISETDRKNISFYDENKNYITDLTMNGYITRTLTYPSGRTTAKYIKWSNDSKPVYDLMFNIGQPLPFEPYGDKGIIKPSGIVESSGKNLLDMNNHFENIYIDGQSKKMISISGADTYWLKVKKNTNYSFSRDKGDRTVVLGTTEYPTLSTVGELLINEGNFISFFTINSGNNEYLSFYTNRNRDAKPNWIMVTEGTSNAEYTPYVEPSTIELPFVPLGINDIKDELIVYADGTGKYIKRVDSVDLGSLNWTYENGKGFYNQQLVNSAKPNANLVCSKYNYSSTAWESNCIGINYSKSLWVGDTSYTDATSFKSAMNGVLLIYELATPQEITLTQAQVAQVLALKTFADVTYIDADGLVYEIGYIMNSAKAIKDLKNIIQSLVSAQTVDDVMESKSLKSAKVVEQIATPIEDDLEEAMPEEDR